MRYPGGIQAGILCISCKSALLPNNELPSSLALPVRSLAVPVTDCPGASGKLLLSLPPPKEGVLYADSKLLQILPSVGFFSHMSGGRPGHPQSSRACQWNT